MGDPDHRPRARHVRIPRSRVSRTCRDNREDTLHERRGCLARTGLASRILCVETLATIQANDRLDAAASGPEGAAPLALTRRRRRVSRSMRNRNSLSKATLPRQRLDTPPEYGNFL